MQNNFKYSKMVFERGHKILQSPLFKKKDENLTISIVWQKFLLFLSVLALSRGIRGRIKMSREIFKITFQDSCCVTQHNI